MNELKVKGLKMIAEGILLIAKSLEETEGAVSTATTKVSKTTAAAPETKAEETEESVDATNDYTAEQLEAMTYNDIKKLAKSLGISAVGNRETIVSAILGSSSATEEDEDYDDEDADEDTADADESGDESEDEEDDDEDEDEDSDDVAAQVNAAVEDMTDDEIRELLEDSGLSTKGKRQALISRLVEAVEDGVIELSDEESSDEESEGEDEDEDTDESADITKDMTKKRRAAFDEICKETEEGFESGEISRDDLIEFINDFNGEESNYKKTSDEELLDTYLRCCAFLISDDGEVSEDSGKYEINGESYCCGHPLVYNEKKKAFVCETCGAKYK